MREGVGKAVVEGIKDTSLGTAKPVTQDFREYYEQFNKVDPKYRRIKITANFTGELLEDLRKSIKFITGNGNVSYELKQSDKKHKPYKQGKGKLRVRKKKSKKPAPSYQKIQGWLEDLGYDYLKLSGETKKNVLKFIRKEIPKLLGKKLK